MKKIILFFTNAILFLRSVNCLIQSVIRLSSNQLVRLPVPPGRVTSSLSGTVKQQVQIRVCDAGVPTKASNCLHRSLFLWLQWSLRFSQWLSSKHPSVSQIGAANRLTIHSKLNKLKLEWQGDPLNVKRAELSAPRNYNIPVPIHLPYMSRGLKAVIVLPLWRSQTESDEFNSSLSVKYDIFIYSGSDINTASWQDNRLARSCFMLQAILGEKIREHYECNISSNLPLKFDHKNADLLLAAAKPDIFSAQHPALFFFFFQFTFKRHGHYKTATAIPPK